MRFPQLTANTNIVIIGLGYVGLPLAIEFGKKYQTIGFDVNKSRINALNSQQDETKEVGAKDFEAAKYLSFTAKESDLNGADVFIVTVPTPITVDKRPDLTALIKASETVGRNIDQCGTVIYESTVYPGATGYSPERINPGDKEHRLANIMKVTSGSTQEVGLFVDALYASIITAGTHLASSVKVAEAAKVIENTQRDINIALVNELAMIFNRMGIDTQEVLEAAGTKWNFLPFKPGLVGGHCIGVDPYYLTYKSEQLGHRPEMILAGRRINDGMGAYVASTLIKAMIKKGIQVNNAKILVMGLAFKENCPDIRNTKVVDIIKELTEYTPNVDVYDPQVLPADAKREYGITLATKLNASSYDAIVLAVAHNEFTQMGMDEIRTNAKALHVVYDLKNIFNRQEQNLLL